jgi:flotillin
MSQEKLSFTIPASISIGPDINDEKQLRRYVQLMVQPGGEAFQQTQVKERVDGIIIGELRAVASNMSVEEIYNNRKYFQSKVHEYISESLHRFGLIVYNSNIKGIISYILSMLLPF